MNFICRFAAVVGAFKIKRRLFFIKPYNRACGAKGNKPTGPSARGKAFPLSRCAGLLHGKASHTILRSLPLPYESCSLATPQAGAEQPALYLAPHLKELLHGALLSPRLRGEGGAAKHQRGSAGMACSIYVSSLHVSSCRIGRLRRPPPIRLRRTSPYSGGRIGLSTLSFCVISGTLSSVHSAPALAGERWCRQAPKGA